MKILNRIMLALWLCLAVPAHAGEIENAIGARMTAFTDAFNAGDAAQVVSFYAENGALLPPRSKDLVGRPAIQKHYADAFANKVSGLQLRILEITTPADDTAIEIGLTKVNFGEQKIFGRYLHVWKRVDDQWMISRDIFNVMGTE